MSVAARDAGKFVVAMYDRADEREHAARALQKPADARQLAVARREQQRADADRRRADRDDLARAQPIHRDAGHEAERRVAVVEEAGHRRDAHGAQAEGLGELRHHHRRRRSQRVLIEVVHRRDQPGDGRGTGCLGHDDSCEPVAQDAFRHLSHTCRN